MRYAPEGVSRVEFGDGHTPPLFYRGKLVTHTGKEVSVDRIRYIKPKEVGQPDIVDDPVQEYHKKRHPREWAAYQATGKDVQGGTSLDKWPAISLDLRLQLSQLGVLSVEQVATMTDMLGAMLGSYGLSLSQQAKDFLSGKEELERLQRQDSVVADLKAEIQALREQVLGSVIAEVPKRRGRPPKEKKDDSTQCAE